MHCPTILRVEERSRTLASSPTTGGEGHARIEIGPVIRVLREHVKDDRYYEMIWLRSIRGREEAWKVEFPTPGDYLWGVRSKPLDLIRD